jgi:hypothetical protein
MRIAILVHGPDFACSENLTKAFALWGETRLISIHPSDWRDYDPGLLVHDDETLEEARAIVEIADLIVLGDATSFYTLARVSPRRQWLKWANRKNLSVFFGDSAYFKYPRYFDGLCMEAGIFQAFFLPNLIPFTSLKAIPLHHPMPVMVSDKAEKLTVMHAPGRDGKAAQKGTVEIEEVVAELQEEMDFDYRRLMYLTLEECLRIKATAHVVVDQLPPPGLPSGLGRTGLEALAAASAVVTSMYDESLVDGFFPYPPAMPIHSQDDLRKVLRRLLEDAEQLSAIRDQSIAWAMENVELEPWLRYVGRHL